MRKGWLALLSASVITGAMSSLLYQKKREKKVRQENFKDKYVGRFSFSAPSVTRKTTHILEITDSLNITIDNIAMDGKILTIDDHKLVVQDKYGYQITIHADEKTPISLSDEAEESIAILKRIG
ncbi:protein of unknown function [Pilibacter termitis]|uniref:DUF4828 domain-containing protein n=1 Tax=Pilibacter termitis TaxID=263852 RepID=A0A1T4NJ80_9ENTE|nr:DUF4828 domain-containing protein [Pilibacter termitis]SJZ79097.1 protein of unknown function [Pilibacter termitis]